MKEKKANFLLRNSSELFSDSIKSVSGAGKLTENTQINLKSDALAGCRGFFPVSLGMLLF